MKIIGLILAIILLGGIAGVYFLFTDKDSLKNCENIEDSFDRYDCYSETALKSKDPPLNGNFFPASILA